jgi:hypothetical protein
MRQVDGERRAGDGTARRGSPPWQGNRLAPQQYGDSRADDELAQRVAEEVEQQYPGREEHDDPLTVLLGPGCRPTENEAPGHHRHGVALQRPSVDADERVSQGRGTA